VDPFDVPAEQNVPQPIGGRDVPDEWAVDERRISAHRAGRRGRMMARLFVLVIVAGLATAGFFLLREFRADQDRAAEERAERTTFEAGDPALETAKEIDAGDVPAGAARLDDLLQYDVPASSDDLPHRIVVSITRWDSTAADSSFTEHFLSVDLHHDTFAGISRSSAPVDRPVVAIGTDFDHLTVIYPDGSERFPRSAFGLEPAPDVALARHLSVDDVLPPVAVEHATEYAALTTDLGVRRVFHIDVAAWKRDSGDSYDAWRSLWASDGPLAPSIYEPSGRQIASRENELEPPPLSTFDDEELADLRTDSGAFVAYITSSDGSMVSALVHDADSGFRSYYANLGEATMDSGMSARSFDWKDAPIP